MARADPSQTRKTKRDKKAKGRYNKYKKGGQHRSTKIKLTNKEEDN